MRRAVNSLQTKLFAYEKMILSKSQKLFFVEKDKAPIFISLRNVWHSILEDNVLAKLVTCLI